MSEDTQRGGSSHLVPAAKEEKDICYNQRLW